MKRRWLSLAALEVSRTLASPRWLLAVFIWLVVAWDSTGPYERFAVMFGVTEWSGWDVHAAAINTFFGVVVLLLPTFVIVSCDGVARDRASRFAHIVVTRCDSRKSWWTAKVAAILVASIVFQVGFLATCLAVATLKGATLSTATTESGRFDFERELEGADSEVDPAYPPVRAGQNMSTRQLALSAYLALGFAAAGLALTALSIKASFTWFPAAAAVTWALSDWVLNWFLKDAYFRISPLSRLAEASHSSAFVERPFSWAASIAIFGLAGMAAVLTGGRWISRVDL